MAKTWSIVDPTPEDMDRPDCSSAESAPIEGYDPATDPENLEEGESA